MANVCTALSTTEHSMLLQELTHIKYSPLCKISTTSISEEH